MSSSSQSGPKGGKDGGSASTADNSDRRSVGRRVPHVRVRKERPIDESPADPERVIRALQRSVDAAEGAEALSPIWLVRSVDLEGLKKEDLRPSLDRVMTARHADEGLESLMVTGVLENLLPEVDRMVGFGDGEWRHKDVWKHTKQVVIQSVPRLELRWAALFHDIGKVTTRSVTADGEVHFHGHAEVGARMFRRLDRRVNLFTGEDALTEEVHFLVLHHLRASCYDGSWTDSAVRRFARETGGYMESLFALSRADMTTKRPEKKRRALRQLAELFERIEELAIQDAVVPPLPKGVGEELMSHFGLPPSRKIGDLKRALEAACEAGEIQPQQPSEYYVAFVDNHRERFGLG